MIEYQEMDVLTNCWCYQSLICVEFTRSENWKATSYQQWDIVSDELWICSSMVGMVQV